MKAFTTLFSAAATALLALSTSVAAQSWSSVDPLVIKGQHFFYKSNGTEFFIRGVAYQQNVNSNGTVGTTENYSDPLADTAGCSRDIPYLTQLRTNVIRVYAVDPTENHDECMSMLADAGIYLVLDLSEPNQSINRNDPQWNGPLYQRYISVIDSFAKYNNVLGFFAGNEVSNDYNVTEASAFVKAAVRDSKTYIKNQNYRSIGVGYATYDGPIRDQLAQYFNCGDQSEAIDFWGYNVYSWCGDSDYQTSGYEARTDFFRSYSVPIFFAEYGCNTGPGGGAQRPFTEVGTIYGDQMTGVWSGGIVYMYFQEENDYGLVTVSGSSASPLPDFTSLSSQLAMVTPSLTNMNDYNPTNSPTTCPPVFNSTMAGQPTASNSAWLATATPLPPTPNQALCGCEMSTLACVATDKNAEDYGDIFGFICGESPKACTGISTNATSGEYGAISQCNPMQQLSFVMNRYYQGQSSQNKASACDFNGKAKTQATQAPSGSCSALVSAAGTNGQGTVLAPSGNAAEQSSAGGSGSGSGASASGSTAGAARGSVVHGVDFGVVQLGLYLVGAVLTGAGMVLL